MGRRAYLYFFIFSSWPALAAINNTIIPPVVVKAPKQLTRSFSSGPKTVVTEAQIRAAGVNTLMQALQNLGGVQLQDINGNGGQVMLNMRGFGVNASSNSLLLVNGIPITNPDLAPPDLNTIPLHEVKQVEIISGSESVLYGDQAVGGIINVITKDEAKEKFSLTCNGGSYNSHNCYASIFNNVKQVKYNITASNNHSDNYRDHNDYDQNLLVGGFLFPYANGRLAFDYQIGNEDMQYPGALTVAQVRQDRQQANNDTDFFTDWNSFFHLNSDHTLNENWHLQTDLARRDMHGHGVLFSPFTQDRTINFIKPTLNGVLFNTLIKTGIDAQADDYNINSAMGPTHDTQQKYGLFILANTPINNKAHLAYGIRGAQQNSRIATTAANNNINRAFASTLGITYQLTDHANLYLRRAESFRFPKADENAFSEPGIHGLRTQRGAAYETGWQWQKNKTAARIGLYQLNLRDEITFDPTQTAQAPFGTNRNLAPTMRRGFTLSGKTPLITDKLLLSGQYNFVNAEFKNGLNAGNRIPLVSENIARAGLNYIFLNHWSAYAEAVFTGNQYAANDDANVATQIGGYTVYNFNLRYTYKQFNATLRFNNIFNKEYYYYTVYQPSAPIMTFYPAVERNVMLTLKYAFT